MSKLVPLDAKHFWLEFVSFQVVFFSLLFYATPFVYVDEVVTQP